MKISAWVGLCSLVLFGLGGCAQAQRQTAHDHSHDHGHDHGQAAVAKTGSETISIDQVKQQMTQGTAIIFIDTRNDLAWGSSDSQIPGAIRIGNNQQLAAAIKDLPKDSFIVPYCT